MPDVNKEQSVRVMDDLALCLISSLGAKRIIHMVISAFVVDDDLWQDCDLDDVIFSCLLCECANNEGDAPGRLSRQTVGSETQTSRFYRKPLPHIHICNVSRTDLVPTLLIDQRKRPRPVPIPLRSQPKWSEVENKEPTKEGFSFL